MQERPPQPWPRPSPRLPTSPLHHLRLPRSSGWRTRRRTMSARNYWMQTTAMLLEKRLKVSVRNMRATNDTPAPVTNTDRCAATAEHTHLPITGIRKAHFYEQLSVTHRRHRPTEVRNKICFNTISKVKITHQFSHTLRWSIGTAPRCLLHPLHVLIKQHAFDLFFCCKRTWIVTAEHEIVHDNHIEVPCPALPTTLRS